MVLYTFYKIVCKDENITDCYVGSTTNFNDRKSKHKGSCFNLSNHNYNYKVYQFIRDNGNWENWEMIIIDTIECETRKDAHIKENEYMVGLNATLNSRKAPIYNDIKEYKRQYYQENKEKCNEKTKHYCINNKEKIKEYKSQYMRQYRHKNK